MPNIKESLEELYSRLHRERKAEVKRRIYMLVLIKEGKCSTRKGVAKLIGVHRNTIRDWLSKYEPGGLDALVQIKSPGAPSGQRSLPERILAARRNVWQRLLALAAMLSFSDGLRKPIASASNTRPFIA